MITKLRIVLDWETSIKNKQGQNLYIGVSSGRDSKSRQVKYLIDILKKSSYIY